MSSKKSRTVIVIDDDDDDVSDVEIVSKITEPEPIEITYDDDSYKDLTQDQMDVDVSEIQIHALPKPIEILDDETLATESPVQPQIEQKTESPPPPELHQDLIPEFEMSNSEELPKITQLTATQLELAKKKNPDQDYDTFSLGDLVAVITSAKSNFIGKICGLPGEVEQYLILSKEDGQLYPVNKEKMVFLCATV